MNMNMNMNIKGIINTKTYKLINFVLPTELTTLIFLFFFGEDLYLLSNKDEKINSYIYAIYNFKEGIDKYFINPKYQNKLVIQNLLYGSAYIGSIELMMKIREVFTKYDKITEKDIIYSIDYALENGQLYYIRYVMYMLKNTNNNLSIDRWLKYCKKKCII